MDPRANLAEQARIMATLAEIKAIPSEQITRADASRRYHARLRLHELRSALHEWIARGGFDPRTEVRACASCGAAAGEECDGACSSRASDESEVRS